MPELKSYLVKKTCVLTTTECAASESAAIDQAEVANDWDIKWYGPDVREAGD
jgi:hypothetical protein